MRAWWTRARRAYDIALCAAYGFGAGLGLLLPAPSLGAQMAILCLGLCLTGLPHGAMDWRVGRALLAPRIGARWWAGFTFVYVATAALVVAVWMAAPEIALIGFLIASALHFGAGDAAPGSNPPWPTQILRGTLPIALPLAFRTEEVLALFGWLAPFSDVVADGVMAARPVLGLAAIVAMSMMTRSVAVRSDRLRSLAEFVSMTLAAVALPPLLFFAVYFCAGHAPRHIIDLASRTGDRPVQAIRQLLLESGPVTAVTVLTALILWQTTVDPSMLTPRAVQTVFIGLAALTAPHMLLLGIDPGTADRALGARPASGEALS